MRPEQSSLSLVMATVVMASLAGQTNGQENLSSLKLEQDPPATRNRFGLSYRMGFNISANFKNLGGYSALSNPGPTPPGAPPRNLWNYENGYVLEDVQGNNSPMTWYWGYTGPRATQISSDGQFLYLSRSGSPGDVSSTGNHGDPQHGVELTYNRELGRSERTSWGLEGAFNYMNVTAGDSRPLYGNVTHQTDAYAFPADPSSPTGYVNPPDPPYYGPFNAPMPGGPNQPVIFDTPTPGQGSSTLDPNGAIITGRRKIDADIYGFRIGPYVEMPLYKKLNLSLSGGLALAAVNSKFRFDETVTIPGIGAVSRSGSGSHSDVLLGGYAGANLSYPFSESWSGFVGAQYQYLDCFSQQVGGKKAELDFSKSFFISVGFGFSF